MDRSRRGKMEYTLGIYEKAMPGNLTWTEKLTVAKNAGYDFLEMSVDETDEKLARLEWSKQERKEILDAMYEVGLPIRSMCLSGHRKYPLGSHDPLIREKSLLIMEKAIDLADDLGIRIIQLAGYDVYYEEGDQQTQEFFVENLQKAVDMASKKGVLLGFETMETAFMNTVEKAMKYVDIIQSPYLQVYPDTGNLKNASLSSDKSVREDIHTGRGHMVAAHLKETIPGHFREIPFGTGHVSFEETITTMWEEGVRRFVAEFWYIGQENWLEDVQFAQTFLKGKFQKVGY
ncbi:l-ribulose-5-phosphate 3-epimerase [Trichococcus palustris]|jgi:L-ribulose-5-phosphate 3-epimerase|uniref:L-ribulose-5-phosphate 3-epimerase n=2 Tax=Trichococcus palustris TaxID=140314 RepID=A0A143YY12_9LACT|nr:l-ribulose-5-phosphate 3-epimerase [Trichococcus palustris]SFL17598.1 L-xylulose 5-phosphate 3-epimerase [Trichococcus palustris]